MYAEGFAPREVSFAIVEKNPTVLNITLTPVIYMDSVSINFRLELLIETSAREVFIFWTLVEREELLGGEWGRRREHHGSNLARLETASELQIYKYC